MLLWQFRNNIVAPFGETVEQVFARISSLRDSLDGPQVRVRHSRGEGTELPSENMGVAAWLHDSCASGGKGVGCLCYQCSRRPALLHSAFRRPCLSR